jgi:D-alanine-D-alanine ligase
MAKLKRRVVVLFGGRSAEHEISCISARSVLDALDPEHNEAIAVGITREGRWRVLDGPPALPTETGKMPEVGDGAGTQAELETDERALVLADGSRAPVDVVFPVLHGPFGEDGAIQGLLELAGVPYVGAGVTGSALGMDKALQKVVFEGAGLKVSPYEVVREPEWRDDPRGVATRVGALGYPVFTKPATLGSSVGIVKVHSEPELAAGLDEAFGFARKAVVEASVEGAREIECAVLGNDDPVASVPGEVIPEGHEFYDYTAKYLDEQGARLAIPADLTDHVRSAIQRMAVAAFRAIDCSGMARVDFFVRGDEVLINEINTIPGFTSISMYPKLWEASGLPYAELIDRLLDLAQERFDSERAKGSVAGELQAGG